MAKKKKNNKKKNVSKKNTKKTVSKKQTKKNTNKILKNNVKTSKSIDKTPKKEEAPKIVLPKKKDEKLKEDKKENIKNIKSTSKKDATKNKSYKKISEVIKSTLLKKKDEKVKDKKKTSKDKEKAKKIKKKSSIKNPKVIISKKTLILISIASLILAILIMYPYDITNYKSDASGKILDIPRYSKLKEECCNYNAKFTSIRSATILKHELNNIIKSYEKLSCDGKSYYYNKDEDFTITEYGIKRGIIFNEIYINYGMGNSCEIDTSFRKIELIPNDYTLEDAVKEGYYTVTDDGVKNIESYQKFLDKVEQKEEAIFRIVKNNDNGYLIIIDLKSLEDGRFKVTIDGTRDPDNKDNVIMAYVYNNIGIYKNKLYAYNGNEINKDMLKTKDVYYLIDVGYSSD